MQIVHLLKQAWLEWYQSRTFELGAALAFYAIFSIAPVIVLAFTAASLVLGKEAAQGRVTQEIESTVGHTVAVAIQATAQYTYQSGSGVPATVMSIVFFGFGATGLFLQLQSALNAIWEVTPKPGRCSATTILPLERQLEFPIKRRGGRWPFCGAQRNKKATAPPASRRRTCLPLSRRLGLLGLPRRLKPVAGDVQL